MCPAHVTMLSYIILQYDPKRLAMLNYNEEVL